MEDSELFPFAVRQLIHRGLWLAALNELGHAERKTLQVNHREADGGVWAAVMEYDGVSDTGAGKSKQDSSNMAARSVLNQVHRRRELAHRALASANRVSDGASVLTRLSALEQRVAQLEAHLGK